MGSSDAALAPKFKPLHQTLADAILAVKDAPQDVRDAVKSAVVRICWGGNPTSEERDIVFAWLSRQQQQDRFGKAST